MNNTYKIAIEAARTLLLSAVVLGTIISCGDSQSASTDRAQGGANTPPPTDRPDAIAIEILNENGIDTRTLMFVGQDIFICFEASHAVDYDSQILAVWGITLGALAEVSSGAVTIVNTAGGEPKLLVKAQSADIRAYTNGEIDFESYMSKIQFIPV